MLVNTPSSSHSTKAILLDSLRSLGGAPVSGQSLAKAIGVSRVAVWKAAESLRDAGYALSADEKGYALDPAANDDFLYPWEFGSREGRVRHFAETDSTMERARELRTREQSTQLENEGLLVVAEKQSAGRGRLGRSWASNQGGLFTTLLMSGGESILRYARTSMVLQLAVARALQKITGIEAQLHWPNDIYIRGNKIAGVLTELQGEADRISWINVGIGINVNNSIDVKNATSCALLLHRTISRKEILNLLLKELETGEAASPEDSQLCAAWNAKAYQKGARVRITDAGHDEANQRPEPEFGTCKQIYTYQGIDDFGRALLDSVTGIIKLEAGLSSLQFLPA